MYIQTMNIDISTKTLLWNYPKTWWSHPILEWNIWMSQNWHLKIQILISEDVCFALIATFLEVPLTYIWMNFFRSNRLSHGASKCRKLSGLVLSLGLACVAPKCCPPLGHLSGCPPHIFEETHPEFQLPFLGKHTKIFRKKFVFEIRGTYATLQTELFCLYLSTVAMLISNSNWVIFGFWTLFWWFWREGLFAQIGVLYGTRMYWFRVPNKWH